MARRASRSFTFGCFVIGLKPSVFKQDSVGINIGSGAWPAPNFVWLIELSVSGPPGIVSVRPGFSFCFGEKSC